MSTYWRRVRFGEATEPPWELRPEPDRGLVAYATRDFAPGELICVEFPVVWVHGHHPFNEEQVKEIMEKVELLSAEDKEAFFAMANVFDKSEFPPAVGVFMTNCFDMTDSIYGTCCAMYLALARLNHSCVPNAQQTHLPETTEEVLYASRFLAKGEEINDCYIDLRQPRQQRRSLLQHDYRFHCQCQACSAADSEEVERDDAMRVQASRIIDDLATLITEETLPAALASAIRFAKELSTRENLFWSVRYLPELYSSIYEIALVKGDAATARKYLDKAHKLSVLLQGANSVDSKKTAALLAKMKAGGKVKS